MTRLTFALSGALAAMTCSPPARPDRRRGRASTARPARSARSSTFGTAVIENVRPRSTRPRRGCYLAQRFAAEVD